MRSFLLGFLLPAAALADASVSYEKEIAPILRTYCAGCHNDKDLDGGLSVETFAQLRAGGDDHANPIAPGNPAESFLHKVLDGSAKPKMPPKDEPQLPPEDLARLRQWIAAGAPGPQRDDSILRTLIVPSFPPAKAARPVTAAAYSADGKLLAEARFASVEIRDTASGNVVGTLTGFPGKVNALHFSRDGRRVIAATGITGLHGVAQLREVASGAVIREFGGHADVLYDAEISPDGKHVATAGYDRVIRIWNAADGTLLHTIDVHKGAIYDLAFDPAGTVLASASADETVKLWRVADGERLDTLNQPEGEQVAVLFTADGQHIISAGADRRIYLWRLVSREKPALNPLVLSRFAHESPICALAMSADDKTLISSASDRSLKLWSLPDVALQHAYPVQADIAPVLAPQAASNRFSVGRMDGTFESLELAASLAAQKETAASVPQRTLSLTEAAATPIAEAEPNNQPAEAAVISVPAVVKGAINSPGDRDLFRFHARAGESLVLEINAARAKSRLDSRIEVLHPDGRPVEQVVLQATRDSWLTFRGKDSDTSDDFRVHNQAQMELNEYLYANGEVVRLWLYPRGPDSGFKVYPGQGKRQPAFFTTALAHPLGQPAYIVRPLPPGSNPPSNGLPVFRLNFENDDDPSRRNGSDSLLIFTAPTDGEYLMRVSDVRGMGKDKEFFYALHVRPQRPDFKVTLSGIAPKISPGSGREIRAKVERYDGFGGPVKIAIENLPPGFHSPGVFEIEAGQISAETVIYADADAGNPGPTADNAVKVRASAIIDGKEIVHSLGTLGDIQLGPTPNVTVQILPGTDPASFVEKQGEPIEFRILPGQTISARVRANRIDFKNRIELGKEDAGRNLSHGLYVDNVGLNGLLIVEGQTEREFFITASPVAEPGVRMFHLKTSADGEQASLPARIRVLDAQSGATAMQR